MEEKYDLIILKNVLEHVIEPKNILNKLKNNLTKNGLLLIIVPNDFSKLQNHLYENNFIKKKFWVYPPEHLSYFNYESLENLAEYCNYNVEYKLTEYPIDLDLFGKNTNYINQNVGKLSHKKRIKITNFLTENCDLSKIMKYYNSMANLGLGRQVIYYLKNKK